MLFVNENNTHLIYTCRRRRKLKGKVLTRLIMCMMMAEDNGRIHACKRRANLFAGRKSSPFYPCREEYRSEES